MKIIFLLSFCSIILLSSCGGDKNTNVDPKTEDVDSLYSSYKKQGKAVPMNILLAHGNLLLERYDYANALKDGAEAYRREPNNIDARLLYAYGLNNRPERTHNDRVSAQKHFKYILKKDPKNLEVLVQLAASYAEMGDTDNAFKYCNMALKIDKHYRDAYILKGKIYDADGITDRAISSFETAIQQDPKFYPAYLYLGDIFQDEKNDPIAIEYFLSADQIEPDNIEILYKLAYSYQHFNKDEEALAVYRRMAKLDADFAVSTFQQGWIKQFHQNQPDSALIFYDMTIQNEPRYVEAWHNIGMLQESYKKDKYEAIKCYQMALKYDKDFELSQIAIKRLAK